MGVLGTRVGENGRRIDSRKRLGFLGWGWGAVIHSFYNPLHDSLKVSHLAAPVCLSARLRQVPT